VHARATPSLKPVIIKFGEGGSQQQTCVALALSRFTLSDAPVGFDPSQIETVQQAGLQVTARMKNPMGLSLPQLRASLDDVKATGARIVIFSEDDVLGYATRLRQTAWEMRQRGLLYGAVEFARQKGGPDLARLSNGQMVRVHSVSTVEAEKASSAQLIDRFVRAARERNIRVAYIRLMQSAKPEYSGDSHHADASDKGLSRSALQRNLDFVAQIGANLQTKPLPWLPSHLEMGSAQPFSDYPAHLLGATTGSSRLVSVLRYSQVFITGLGVLGATYLLLSLILDWRRRAQFVFLGAGTLAVGACALSFTHGARVLAFVAAFCFPIVALMWGGLPRLFDPAIRQISADASSSRMLHTCIRVLVTTSLLTIIGALHVVALLNGWKFLSKTEDFLGTKAVQLMPLIAVTLLFSGAIFPHRVTIEGAAAARHRLWKQCAAWMHQPFTVGVAGTICCAAMIVTLWILRSGNDSGLNVPFFEWQIRAALEHLFFARPRTKEVILGFPALCLAGYFALRSDWPWALASTLIAAIGQVDLMNTFCQVNNPLLFSLWRSMLGLLLGGLLGTVTVLLLSRIYLVRPQTTEERILYVHPLPQFAGSLPFLPKPKFGAVAWATTISLCVAGLVLWTRYGVRRGPPVSKLDVPSRYATWPWPSAQRETLGRGITHWLDQSSPDGTTLELFEFDFAANPSLHFEMYDQDENDEKPFNNQVFYWKRGLGHTVGALNTGFAKKDKGRVVAAWNGLFFGLKNLKPRTADWGFHLTPVVIRGRVLPTYSNHRWTFGVQRRGAQSVFQTQLLPDRDYLSREFDYASGGAQCLVRNGVPLRIQPFPDEDTQPLRAPVPTSADEAGHIPSLDHIRTSRISMGWTQDSRRLYLLCVKEPDGEVPSRQALAQRLPASDRRSAGGWMLSDVQRFWLALRAAKGVTEAINSDGGDVAQLAYRRADGDYAFLPPRFALNALASKAVGADEFSVPSATQRLVFSPQFEGALPGGTLMYFYVRDESAQ
jgi:hypothetical protein